MALTVEAPGLVPLLFGLWTEADDAGTFEWKPLTLKARILPALADRVDGMMDDLTARGFIKRFTFDGRPYGVVRNFVKFQRPKSPKDVHPFSNDSREFAGFTADGRRPNATTGRKSFSAGSELDADGDGESGNEFGTSSEAVPNSPGNSSGISAQMEDGGGRREEKKEPAPSLRSGAPPAGELSDEETFWQVLVPQLEAAGIARSRLAQIGKMVGDFTRACQILRDVLKAKQPDTYLGGVLKRLRDEAAAEAGVVVPLKPKKGEPNPPPEWVADLRATGQRVEWLSANRWRDYDGDIVDDRRSALSG